MNNEINQGEAKIYLTEVITQAGKILREYFISRNFISRHKEGVDFTTQADEEVDAFLREKIKEKYEDANFLTEETAPSDYSALRETENLWVIDPLDGTVNFSRKNPHFAISIALVDKAVPRLGVVYAPMLERLYWAQADQEGAFNGGLPIRVSQTADLRETVLACDWAWNLEKRLNIVSWLGKIATHVRQIKCMGSAVVDLAGLAEGELDVYLHSGLKPWDVAASALFIEKAGGKITTPQGGSWDVFNPDMLASNGILHEKLLDLINK